MTNNRSLQNTLLSIVKNVGITAWSLVGVLILVLASIAIFGSGSWVENLNIASEKQTEQQPAPAQQQPQQPQQPTQEQLSCVSDELGEERFTELQQGGQPTQEETTLIQECLQS